MTSSNCEYIRQNAKHIAQNKLGLSEKQSVDLERGVYNWTIEYSNEHGIIKNWDNITFTEIYKNKCRSVFANLDKNTYIGNKRLITRLEENEFLPRDIPYMKPDNMFPERWRDILETKMRKDAKIGENTLTSMTDQFRCSRCKKRECVYHSIQLRSADEPETIFVRCLNCGKSWRMG